MITTYDELMPMVLPELRNCPEPLVRQALERAGRAFCRHTSVWQKTLEEIDVVADEAEYALDPDETVPDGDVQRDPVTACYDERTREWRIQDGYTDDPYAY
jgi:hypothetical protein